MAATRKRVVTGLERHGLRDDQLVDLARRLGQGEQGVQRRREQKLAAEIDIIKPAHAQDVAGQRQSPRATVPKREGEIAAQPVCGLMPPTFAGRGDEAGFGRDGGQAQRPGQFRPVVQARVGGDDRAVGKLDRLVADPPPASTLMIVSGFARPEFKVEVEVVAAGD